MIMSLSWGSVTLALLLRLPILARAQLPAGNVSVDEYSDTQVWSLIEPIILDPIELAPFTDDGLSVTIPDYSQSDLLFRPIYVRGQIPFNYTEAALDLWTEKVPLTPRSQALYDTLKIIYPSGIESNRPPIEVYDNGTANRLIGNYDMTTLAGMHMFWLSLAPFAVFSNDCDCRENKRQKVWPEGPPSPSMSFAMMQLVFFVEPSLNDPPEAGWYRGKQHSKDCSPRYFAQGRLKHQNFYIPGVTGGQPDEGYTFPVTHDIVLAQFNMVSDLLRNETAVSILEGMKVNRKAKDEVGARIVKVAGLPESALGNMRGWLTIRQYGLYQALHRGDNNCPIPVTTCGKSGPNPCDVYPPKSR